MQNWRIFGAMFALGAVVSVAPGTARALSCALPSNVQKPADGALDVGQGLDVAVACHQSFAFTDSAAHQLALLAITRQGSES